MGFALIFPAVHKHATIICYNNTKENRLKSWHTKARYNFIHLTKLESVKESKLHKLKQVMGKQESSQASINKKLTQVKLTAPSSPQHLKDMPLAEFQKIAEKDLARFSSPEILEALLWRSWALSKEQVRRISPEAIQSISPRNLHHMIPKTLKMMSPKQVAAFTILQIRALSPMQMSAITDEHFRAMTEEQIKALLPTQIEVMSGQQIMNLAASGQLGFMKDRQFMRLPKEVRKRIHDLKELLFSKVKRRSQRQIA